MDTAMPGLWSIGSKRCQGNGWTWETSRSAIHRRSMAADSCSTSAEATASTSSTYDFGDHWHHLIEQLLVVEPAPRRVRCVDGARARPPEHVSVSHGCA